MYSSVATINKMIEDGNIEEARIRILNSIQMNESNEYFKDLMYDLENKSINIFSLDDGSELILDRDQWTIAYFSKIRTMLKFNFSKEKLEHYNDVAVYLLKEKNKSKVETKSVEKDRNRESVTREQVNRVADNNTTRIKTRVNPPKRDINIEVIGKDKNKTKLLDFFKVISLLVAFTGMIICFIKLLAKLGNLLKNIIK